MIDEKQLSQYHIRLEKVYDKAVSDIKWQIGQLSEKRGGEIAKILNSSNIKARVKKPDSILRKCRRDGIENLDDISTKVEDILGLRIVTVNKDQARQLFDELHTLQEKEKTWFCEIAHAPHFVAYTIQDKNNYSLKTGYQAYHITFIYTRSYGPLHEMATWPVEIQIMSQLWDFWAEYSRKYFYAGTDSSTQFLPYNAAISKILDSADELMATTAQIITQAPPERDIVTKTVGVAPTEVSAWFDRNLAKYFGQHARKPIELFLAKIAEELNLNGIDLDGLEKILSDKEIRAKYQRILQDSNVPFLPPYQQILCCVLLRRGLRTRRVVDRVNNELWLTGIKLWAIEE